jgi:1,4-alpha-glucan branching enzyme
MPAVPPEREQIEWLVRGEHHEPHRLLGAHLDGDQVAIRAWRPDATGVVALIGDERVMLTEIHPAGLFEVVLAHSGIPAYLLEVTYGDRTFIVDDPYRFWPTIGELDQHLK